MAESLFARWWNSIKPVPPPPGHKKPSSRLRPQQRRLIYITLGVIAAGAIAWGINSYIAAAPQRAQKEFDQGEKFMGPANYPKAIQAYTRAIQILPSMAEAYAARGLAYHATGDDEKALADLEQAILLNPSLTNAYNMRGIIERSRGHNDKALEEWAKSIQAQPNVDAYFERGQLYESMGEYAKAIADYDQAVSYLPDGAPLYRARAFAKSKIGDEQGAQADRDTALHIEQH